MNKIDVDCIIPVFNEEMICSVVEEIISIRLTGYELFLTIVDDGSDVPIVLPFDVGNRIQIIRHDKNMGNSSAIKTGLFSTNRELVVLMDGDGQHADRFI